MNTILRGTEGRPWRLAALALCVVNGASVLSVLGGLAGPRASNPALLTLYYAGIASPTLICLCMFLDARHRAFPLRTQLFWAAMSIVVPSFTLAVYVGHILRHTKI